MAQGFAKASGGGGSGHTHVHFEVPSGAVNGSNVTFTLASTPVSGSVQVFVGGVQQRPQSSPGLGECSVSGTTLTMGWAPPTGARLWVHYET